MIKTKYFHGEYVNYGTTEQSYKTVDQVINEFLEAENIHPEQLIDIKFSSVGYYRHDEGEQDPVALLIYKEAMSHEEARELVEKQLREEIERVTKLEEGKVTKEISIKGIVDFSKDLEE